MLSKKEQNKLVESHLYLISFIIRKRGFRYSEDLYQDGCLALIKAAQLFDPNKEVKFSTYAAYWLRSYFGKYCVRNSVVHETHRNYEYRKSNHKNAIVRPEVLFQYENSNMGDQNFERLLNINFKTDYKRLEARSLLRVIKNRLDKKPERTRKIFELYFVQNKTLQDIGDELGVCRERIRQIIKDVKKEILEGLV